MGRVLWKENKLRNLWETFYLSKIKKMNVAHNIKKLRLAQNRSQQEIADLLEIERKTYANWEMGQNDIKSEFIPKLSEIFNVEIQDLFEDKEKVKIINNSTNSENANGGQHGFIVNISDKETATKLFELVEKLMKTIEK
jgi:transcriptional regulator with XRE-family HTH domain